jgi:hypothetical protein
LSSTSPLPSWSILELHTCHSNEFSKATNIIASVLSLLGEQYCKRKRNKHMCKSKHNNKRIYYYFSSVQFIFTLEMIAYKTKIAFKGNKGSY